MPKINNNKPGRPPLNKPAVSVKIYESDKQQMQIIKDKTGKPIIEQISEMVAHKSSIIEISKSLLNADIDNIQDFETLLNKLCRDCRPQIIDEMARERKSE